MDTVRWKKGKATRQPIPPATREAHGRQRIHIRNPTPTTPVGAAGHACDQPHAQAWRPYRGHGPLLQNDGAALILRAGLLRIPSRAWTRRPRRAYSQMA